MDNDYYSVDAILAENQVSTKHRCATYVLNFLVRKYNVTSRSTSRTWATLTAVLNVMCVSLLAFPCRISKWHFEQIKALSKMQLPYWLAPMLLYSYAS